MRMILTVLLTQLIMFAARSYFSDEQAQEGAGKAVHEGHARFEGDENMEYIADAGFVPIEGVTQVTVDYCIS